MPAVAVLGNPLHIVPSQAVSFVVIVLLVHVAYFTIVCNHDTICHET